MQPFVSICIPTYNGERFLAETLESVLSQTYQALEVLIVDDCSFDSSINIVKSFQDRDNRVRLIRNDKQIGMVQNWNKSIIEAKGEWVKLQFQDDLMDPSTITKMMSFASESQTRLVLTERKYFFEDGLTVDRKLHHISSDFSSNSVITPAYFINLLIKYGLNQNFVGEPIIGMFHKSLINEIGYYNQSLNQIVDLDFWIRAVLSEPIGYLPEPLHFFRVHKKSQSMENNRKKLVSTTIQDRLKMGSEILKHNATGIDDVAQRELFIRRIKRMINQDISSVGAKHIQRVIGPWILEYYQPNIWTSIRSRLNEVLNDLKSKL